MITRIGKVSPTKTAAPVVNAIVDRSVAFGKMKRAPSAISANNGCFLRAVERVTSLIPRRVTAEKRNVPASIKNNGTKLMAAAINPAIE